MHRPCGRAHSPPTWAWYEQLQPEDLDLDEDSDGEHDEESGSDSEGDESESGSEGSVVILDDDQSMDGMKDDADSVSPPSAAATTELASEGFVYHGLCAHILTVF